MVTIGQIILLEDFNLGIIVGEDSVFSRQGADIYVDSYISFTQAILGGNVEVPTLSGKMQLRQPTAAATPPLSSTLHSHLLSHLPPRCKSWPTLPLPLQLDCASEMTADGGIFRALFRVKEAAPVAADGGGTLTMAIPKGVQHGQLVPLRGKGMPKNDFFLDHGDQYVRFCINFPSVAFRRIRRRLNSVTFRGILGNLSLRKGLNELWELEDSLSLEGMEFSEVDPLSTLARASSSNALNCSFPFNFVAAAGLDACYVSNVTSLSTSFNASQLAPHTAPTLSPSSHLQAISVDILVTLPENLIWAASMARVESVFFWRFVSEKQRAILEEFEKEIIDKNNTSAEGS
ncbi:hypothetical protein BUALT_Bualt08G0028000 [Buddleja alternifolia]|uniref:Chaperone DnaJ C-terminal domain-containing protein n=1 Tax=Buddleja alternifolia TaxID=168488 RepID=A0AAV6X789_9LAMI|nr:hypothetical protein BUALT_Bualt08G0028000 [Buddleja alternifolia]